MHELKKVRGKNKRNNLNKIFVLKTSLKTGEMVEDDGS
jgi:hypothetical protein